MRLVHSRASFCAQLAASSATAAGAALMAPRAAAQGLVDLRVALLPGDIGAECWYAQDLGAFRAAGLNAQISGITNGGAISAAVASGSIEIGYSNVITLAVAHEHGIPFSILAPANLHLASAPANGLLAVAASSSIRTAKDLEGKTIAVSGLNNIAHFAARAWIDRNGGDSSLARYVELPLTEMAAALRAGRVDAAGMDALGDPNLGKPGDSLRLLASTFNAVSPNFLPSVWFSTTGWIAAHPQEARRFVAVIRRMAAWANGHHHDSAEILARHTKLTVEQLATVTRVTYGTVLNASLIQPNIDVAARYGALRTRFSARDLISPTA